MGKLSAIVISFSVALGSTALAAPVKNTSTKPKDQVYLKKMAEMAPVTEEIPAPTATVADLQKIIELSEKRRPAASGAIGEENMSADLKRIRDQFLAIKTSDDLASLIAELNANYAKLPTDAKFLVAQITPAQSLRGIVYKLRNVFEKRSRAAHSVVLTTAKNISTNLRIYLPQENMKAVQEYFMSPYFVEGQVVDVLKDEADIQALLTGELAAQIRLADERLGQLNLTEPIVWDQRFSYGPKSFQDGLNRFRLIGELEKSLVRSAMMSTLSGLYVLRAYNIDGTIDLSADIGRLYGIDGFISAVDGVSAEKTTREIRKRAQVGALMPDGKASMMNALNASRWASVHAWAAWKASSKERRNEQLYAIDSGYWRVNREDVERNLEIAYRVINSTGSEKIRSSVTGEVIEINYSSFFTSPPENLQLLLPTGFDRQTNVSRQAATTLNGKTKTTLKYRNYGEGSPEAWNVAAYSTYFPSVKNNDDVFRTVRVLSHAGGSWLNIVK